MEVLYITAVLGTKGGRGSPLRGGGKPPFLDTYLLDIFTCGYISISTPDHCLRSRHVVYF